MKITIFGLIILVVMSSCKQSDKTRSQISLNGEWEITKTNSFSEIPSTFASKVTVPGLVDLAVPALDSNRNFDNGVYWHKTNFTLNNDVLPELVNLKIGKAKYHARVYLNKQYVGEQLYCFTSASFDIRKFLNPMGVENELLIGIGTSNNMPDTVMWGQDFEKLTYIPGIYDNVELILSGFPFIRNIQTVPMIKDEKVRIVADIDDGGRKEEINMSYLISEVKSGKIVVKGEIQSTDFTVSIPDCQLWTPESPFLYELKLSTGADEENVRFGMRSFSFEKETGRALLNGKPYYMRGTNVCVFRFFEDPERDLLPWDEEWVIRLHQQFKNMHWNSIRYCIGLPPERWYEIADSVGFLIQNEYPVWTGGNPKGFENFYPGVTAERLANEYRAWLPEHWNHVSVVIWDAQNESVTNITGEAINMVRNMDLSNRPWENGWAPPQSDTDPIEAHPYLFSRYSREGKPSENGPLADFLSSPMLPFNTANDHMPPKDKERYQNPLIINEYGWLWLNRDGSTTTLTDRVYDVAFGKNLSKEERIYQYNRHLGMLTEYWRAHRYCAGVLHFCGLAYSRPEEPRGQTSDNFIDIKNLVYEPLFEEYVKPSFAPVGLMINFWDKTVSVGNNLEVEVYTINDLDNSWNGSLTMTLLNGSDTIIKLVEEIEIPALDRVITSFNLKMPSKKGDYQLVAEINFKGESVKSIRDFSID